MIVYDDGDRLQYKDSTGSEHTVATRADRPSLTSGGGIDVTGSVDVGYMLASLLSTDADNALAFDDDGGLFAASRDSQAGYGHFRLSATTTIGTSWTELPLVTSAAQNCSASGSTVTLGSGIWFVMLTVNASTTTGNSAVLYASITSDNAFSNYTGSFSKDAKRVGTTATTVVTANPSSTVVPKAQYVKIGTTDGGATAYSLSLWCIRVGAVA
jgi:hypothetical protein